MGSCPQIKMFTEQFKALMFYTSPLKNESSIIKFCTMKNELLISKELTASNYFLGIEVFHVINVY